MASQASASVQTELSKVLNLSYFSGNAWSFYNNCVNLANNPEADTKLVTLDKNADHIFSPKADFTCSNKVDWRVRLSHVNGDMAHYREFLAFTVGWCTSGWVVGNAHCKCQECKRNRVYDGNKNKPSSLLKLIRNVDQHAPEKMNYFPGGVIETVLYPKPKGYFDRQAFVDYWLEKIPKLFPFVTALVEDQEKELDWSKECPADQAVDKLRSELNRMKNRAENLVNTYVCKVSDRKQFNLDVLMLDAGIAIEGISNKLIKVKASSLTVQHGFSQPLKYPMTPTGSGKSFNLITEIDLFNKENCESTDCVVLVIKSNLEINQVEAKLGTFARFTLEEELEGYVERWLVDREVDSVDFSPEPQTEYRILAPTFIYAYPHTDVAVQKIVPGLMCLSGFDSCIKYMYVGDINRYEYTYEEEKKKLKEGTSLQLILWQNDSRSSKVARFMFLTRQEELTSQTSEKLVFVSAGPGEGKTATLKHLLFKCKSPGMKVLHTTARNLIKFCEEEVTILDAIRSSVAPLEFEAGDTVLLLIDAMDEAEDESIEYVKKIAELEKFKIIASMRSYLEPKIRHEFPRSKIFKLAALATGDKMAIILKYWKSKAKCIDNESKADAPAKSIIENYNKYFELTPLYCTLLAEIHEDLLKQSEASMTYSLIEIYEQIISKNFTRYFSEKKKFSITRETQDVYDRLHEEYIYAHVFLALKLLWTPEGARSLKGELKHPNITLTPGQGFLSNKNPVAFAHRTFAEYFVDCWVFKVLPEKKLQGKVLESFSQLFMTRYLQRKEEPFFLNHMLAQQKIPIWFCFKLERINIDELVKMSESYGYSPEEYMTRFILTSLAVESRELVIKAVKESEPEDQVARRLLGFSLRKGYYDMVCLLIQLFFPKSSSILVSDGYPIFIHMLSAVLDSSAHDSDFVVKQRKQIIKLLVKTFLTSLNDSDESLNDFVGRDAHEVPTLVKFELLQYVVDRIKEKMKHPSQEQVLQDILLPKNTHRDNLLHTNTRPEFIREFCKEFPKEFYELANSINRKGETYYSRPPELSQARIINVTTGKVVRKKTGDEIFEEGITKEIFKDVDSCIKHFNMNLQKITKFTIASQLSVKSSNGSNLLKFLTENKKDGWNNFSVLLQEAGLVRVGDRVSGKIKTGAFDSLLAAFRACTDIDNITTIRQQIEEVAKSFTSCDDELSSYYMALYIRNGLLSSPQDEEFQDRLIGTVLATEGVKFKYPMCCHLLNDMIADIVNDLDFQLSKKHVDAMRVNDSSFIVACKSGNGNIAELLAKSFMVEWMSCLDDFQLLCVFRALNQHCGDLLDRIVDELADHDFSVPIKTAQESLITGNLRLLRLYVEKLKFPEDKFRGNVYLIVQNSCLDNGWVIERKKKMINYVRQTFPESFKRIVGKNWDRVVTSYVHEDFQQFISDEL